MNLALFDLDNTLLAGDSDVEWPRYLMNKGLMDKAAYGLRNDKFYEEYKNGTLDIDEFLSFQLQPLSRFSRQELDTMHKQYMKEYILPIITPQARAKIKQHQDNCDITMIITATNRFVTAPIARELGVEHLIAVELEEDNTGNFTGRYRGIPSYREGKITRLKQWLAERKEKLEDYNQIWFYSDSRNDLPLLSLVTHPVAVDPDPMLKAHAQQQGWPVISLRGAF